MVGDQDWETNMTINKNITFQEQLTELESKLQSLNSQIIQAETFLAAKPDQIPTISRYNLLCHSKSEILTKIRKLKEKMKN